MPALCKWCLIDHTLHGSDIASLPQTEEELAEHIESEHHTAVQRPGETEEECTRRFYAAYPEALDPRTCKCPECKARRKAEKN